MKQNDVLVKWTGSKRIQAQQILQYFPPKIATYYEPFFGGGSLLYTLMSSPINVKIYECSDINGDLMAVWRSVQETPLKILDFYSEHWPCRRETYYRIRNEFNADRDPRKFFLLLRTCHNGTVRFNSKGEFNVAYHEGRPGVSPVRLRLILQDWHEKLQKVRLVTRDYSGVQSQIGDFIYLDPPYPTESPVYCSTLDYPRFWEWLRAQQGGYALSMNGIDVPESVYTTRYLMKSGFQRLNRTEKTEVSDSLYCN